MGMKSASITSCTNADCPNNSQQVEVCAQDGHCAYCDTHVFCDSAPHDDGDESDASEESAS